jgi:hypothetical protein
LKQLWAEFQADFMGNPIKHPSKMANQSDVEGRQQYYDAICFPPESQPPHSPEEDVTIFTFLAPSLLWFPSYINAREIRGQSADDAAVEPKDSPCNGPFDLIFERLSTRIRNTLLLIVLKALSAETISL